MPIVEVAIRPCPAIEGAGCLSQTWKCRECRRMFKALETARDDINLLTKTQVEKLEKYWRQQDEVPTDNHAPKDTGK